MRNSDTPEWRKGPDGTHSLCNACGLRFKRKQKKAERERNEALAAAAERAQLVGAAPISQ